jgi:tetratricopeptide (TPR) repeat protein
MPRDDDDPRDSRNDLSGTARDVVQAGKVSGGLHFHQETPRPRGNPTPQQLPADVRAFVNRTEEQGQLNAVLAGREGGQVVLSVHVVAGTAGAGKTSLVLHWAHQVKDRFPDGQLFVNLRGYDPGEPVSAGQALRRFLRALGVPPAEVPQDADDAAALYRSLLADRRMLVVLDNAATAGQVRPLLPGSGDSLVVVTSRNRLAGLAVRDGARRITLGTLPEPEAVALLRAVTSGYRAQDDEESLAQLAGLCARLPLALRIAAERAASHPHLRLDDLIADLRDESALWDALSTGSDEDAEAVHTVFTWSYRALAAPAARLFRLLGLHPGPEFSLHATAALADLTVSRARQLLDDLVGAHLLEQTAPDRFQFHDLLRVYATEQGNAEEPSEERHEALRRVLAWYLHTADAAQGVIKPAEARLTLTPAANSAPSLAFAGYDAAVDWSEREHPTLRRLVPAASAAGFDTLAWQLAEVLWHVRSPSTPVTDWTDTGRAGLAAAERAHEPAARIRLLSNLGMVNRRHRRLSEALEQHCQALRLARAAADTFEEARSLNLIGLVHLECRRFDEAGDHFERAATLFRDLREPRREALALSNAASTRLDAGRLPEARTAARRALDAHRALGGQEGVGNALYIVAEVGREQGELEAARHAVDEALDIALALRNHTREAFWLLTLGDVQRAAGEYGDALASYQRSAMLHRRLGDRSREALAWRGTGLAYTATDRAEDAAAFHRQAVVVHRELRDAWQLGVELDHLAACVHEDDPEAARARWVEALTCLAPYTDPRAAALRTRIQVRLADRG